MRRHTSLAGLQRTLRTLIQPGLVPVDLLGVPHYRPSRVVGEVTVRTDVLTSAMTEANVVSQLLLVLVMRTTQTTHHGARA